MTMADQSPSLAGFRSIVEVVNESELLKKGIVMAAGGHGNVLGASMGWRKFAKDVKALYGVARAVQTMGGHIKSMFSEIMRKGMVQKNWNNFGRASSLHFQDSRSLYP